MSSHGSRHESAKEMIDALKVARDRLVVQAHLLSLDARKRWEGIETRLFELETKLERDGEKIAESVVTNFREATQAAKELVRELDGTLELAAPVKTLMKQAPQTCAPDDTLNRAAQIMWELDCGAVPVVGMDGHVAGIVTDRDICMAAYTRGQPLAAMSVESAMSKRVYTCSPEHSVGHAARLMALKQIRRLPVVEAGKLIGVLALSDIAREVSKGHNREPACVALAHTLAAISEQRNHGAQREQAAAE
jgi:predicted transcriptional regulator